MPMIQYRDFNFKGEREAIIRQANSIIREYASQGYVLTLRQLYYQFVSRDLIPNTERSYKNLGSAISDGRDAGMIDWNAIEDRGRGISAWRIEEDEKEVLRGIQYGFALDYWERQDVYVEVWVEKDALSSVIERACSARSVPYMACKGYLSASEAWRARPSRNTAASPSARCRSRKGSSGPAGRPEKVKHAVSVPYNGFRYYAFTSRDNPKEFTSAVPQAREIVNPAP